MLMRRTLVMRVLRVGLSVFCRIAWQAIRIWQYPAVLREKTPKFFFDETYRPAVGRSYAIFAMTGARGVGEDVWRMLSLLRRMTVNTVAVVNGRLNEKDLADLGECVHRIMVRPNLGRDFGGWRAATLKMYDERVECERVLYLNDSVYFLDVPELEEFFRNILDLGRDYDLAAATESREHSYHLQSYVLAITGEVFGNQAIQAFWRDYRPYNLRIHAINAGEIGLSRVFCRCRFRKKVLYSLSALSHILNSLSPAERFRDLELLSSAKLANKTIDTVPRMAEEPMNPTPNGQKTNSVKTAERYDAQGELFWRQHSEEFFAAIGNMNPAHHACGFFHRYMGMPIVKKDLYFREIFPENGLARIFADLDDAERSRLLNIQISRGRQKNGAMNTLRRLLRLD